jgi:putative nucleotidyltransferase with HDIG domain/PAS domain S-box-containing protein
MDEDEKKTRFLDDLDRVRRQISEIEEVELERAKTERALKEEKGYLSHLLEELSTGILSVNVQGEVKFINSATVKKLRMDMANETERIDVWKHPVFVQSGISKGIRNCLDTQKKSTIESLYKEKTGKKNYFKINFTPLFNKDGSINGVMVMIEDVSEKKKVETDLKQKLEFEEFMSKILSKLIDFKEVHSSFKSVFIDIGKKLSSDWVGLFLFNEDNHHVAHCTYEWHRGEAGLQPKERRNIPLDELSWMKEKFNKKESVQIEKTSEMNSPQKSVLKLWLSEKALSFVAVPVHYEDQLIGFMALEWITEYGKWTELDISILMEVSHNLGYVLGQKKADETKMKANDRFYMLAQAGFEAIVILKEGIVADANHAASSLFEYKPSEYIGKDLSIFFDSNEKKVIEGYMMSSKSHPLESKGIKKSGEVIPIEIFTKTLLAGDEQRKVLGIRDMTGREKIEKDSEERYEKLKKTMEGIVKALASSIEFKDPYTAGHMQRVTRLSCAIAEEMGISKERIEGLRIAASIHDIGKIGVPAEILNKPDKLTEAERMIVESHPKTGYDILKNINFPWPVADIVLQHHERMDGSGYPSGLSGDEILMESRIIGVADIVEALTSRRPHRSALEKGSFINELKKNKKILYDPDVVNACLKVINNKHFSFQTFNLENS